MAEVDNYLARPSDQPVEDTSTGTAGDFARTLGGATAGVGSNLAAGARYFYEAGGSENGAAIAKGIQDIFGALREGSEEGIHPETKKIAAATFTSPEFWDHPLLATALKTTGMVPAVAAMAIPGGLLADAVGATVFAAGSGAAINSGAGLDEFYKKLDAMPDKELQEQAPKYKAMREIMDESDARARFNREAQGWGPALNAIFGAAAAVVGPAGVAARGLAGGTKAAVLGATEEGALKSAGLGAAEGAVSNAAQAAVSDVTGQHAEMEAGMQKEFDLARTANAAAEGGFLGGITGGAVGLVAGGHSAAKPAKETPSAGTADAAAAVGETPANEIATTPKTGRATSAQAKPVESADIGNPQNAPTRSERDLSKGNKKTAAPKKPEVPQPIAPDAAITAAIASNEAPPTAQPTEHAAMTERSPNATLDKLDQEGQPRPPEPAPPGPASVPFMITAKMKADLAARGATPEQISNMTPAQAHETLAKPVEQAAAPAPLDTGLNVPETPQTTAEQIKQIGTGDRKAVMLPQGTVVPADVLGGRTDLKRLKLGRGTFIYDPKLTSPAEITKLSKLGRENEILGLGPVSKPEAVSAVSDGATPVAITERTPDGTEVKTAAGSTRTLPDQVASLEAQKSPGNVVSIESPENVLKRRVLDNQRVTGETTNLKDFEANKRTPKEKAYDEEMIAWKRATEEAIAKGAKQDELPMEPTAPPPAHEEVGGKKYSADERAAVEDKLSKQKEIVEKNAAGEGEDNYLRNPAHRNKVIERARTMVADAEDAGIKIQKQLKLSEKGDAPSDHESTIVLALAKKLVAAAKGDPQGRVITEAAARFKEDEALVKAGFKKEVIDRRLAEGDEFAKQRFNKQNASDENLSKEGQATKLDDGTEKTAEGVTRQKAVTKEVTSEVKAETAAKYGGTQLTPEQLAEFKKNKAIREAAKNARRAEALVVEDNPTEAQRIAGNYKKGHIKVDGIPVSVETRKGMPRHWVDETTGERGTTKAPDHYGYIPKTEGADGDHVDAYVGTGDKHFVIDQLDHRTGQFDEHKVMLNYKNEADAVAAYRRAFSDGRADERLGNITPASKEELDAWRNSGKTKEPYTKVAIDRDMGNVNFDSPTPGSDRMRTAIDGTEFRSVKSTTAGELLDKMDLSKIPGVGGVMSRFIQSRLKLLAKDVEVHIVSPEDMANLSHDAPDALALHARMASGGRSEVYLSTNAKDNGVEVGSKAHALLHELVHAVTVREIANVPGAEAQIRNVMFHAVNYANENIVELHLEFGNKLRYGFTNTKEFIAEAFSNKDFQSFLARVPIDEGLAAHLGIRQKGRVATAWDAVRFYVKKAIEKVTGELPQFDSALDAIMRIGDTLTSAHERNYLLPRDRLAAKERLKAQDTVNKEALGMVDDTMDAVKRYIARPENNTAERSPKMLALRTFDNLADVAGHFFEKAKNPVRTISQAIERMRVRGDALHEKSGPLAGELASLRASNRAGYEDLSSVLHDATVANVHPDVPLSDEKNSHLGKKKIVGDAVWSKAQHESLAKRYRALPEDMKAAYHKILSFYKERQNQMTREIIRNQVEILTGSKDAALSDRIHTGNVTDADRSNLGSNLDVIERAGELSKIEGPYVPLIRRGDHVVQADRAVAQPGNAKRIAHNEFEFKTDKEAADYAKANDLRSTIKKVWVDEKTGELHQVDPASGEEHRMSKEDLDSVARYRVEVSNRHVEFVQGKRAAQARADELAKDASLTVHEVVPRKYEPSGRAAVELSTALGNLRKKLEKSDAFKNATPTQQASLLRGLEEASLASHGSTRVSSRALPRRGVQGYSEDTVQGLVDYSASSSRYIAKLEHASALEAGLKEMQAQLTANHSKTGLYARTAISNEVLKRVEGDNGFKQGGTMAPIVKRLLSASFTDKLGSPAYSVINGMQVGMVTAPYLSGRHGVIKAVGAIAKAYNDIGGLGTVKSGIAETGRRIVGKKAPEDFMARAMKGVNAEEKEMFKTHLGLGTIDPSAGFEIGNINRDYSGVGGKVDAVLGYLESVTREMPRAIESINRTVTALSSYRLERAAGADHDTAVQHSIDAVNRTQFNYSPTNSPAAFNHPLLKIALQFKKYGQAMYQLIGQQVTDAIRNENPGDRARAVKTLIGLAATHTAIAGALGLPTEPFKYLLMGAHAAGLTGMTWSDVEDKIRHGAANTFGKTAGEVVTRGLPRLFNVDLSRAGLDSVTSFGEPKSAKESDVKTWLFDSLSGPVVSLGGDWVKGLNNIANGNFEKAAEQMIPLKAAADSLRAYRQVTEGKKSQSGRETLSPYTPTEAAMRVLGFGSGREAEAGAASSAYYRQSTAQKEARSQLVNDWAQASAGEKTKSWAAIQKWNKEQPEGSKITPKELTDKTKRDAKASQTEVRGIRAGKRDKRFLDEGNVVYNTR